MKLMDGKVLNHEAKVILNAGRKEGRIKGQLEGRAESILEVLEEYGTIPLEIRQRILAERKVEQLKEWLKLSIKAASVEQFVKEM